VEKRRGKTDIIHCTVNRDKNHRNSVVGVSRYTSMNGVSLVKLCIVHGD